MKNKIQKNVCLVNDSENDLCTTAGNARYLATHSNLDQNRVTIGEYPSGHMAYLGKESFDLLAKDMRAFFESCI